MNARGRVLIISSPFFDYHISVKRAFESLGFNCRVETYDEPIHPFHGLLKWRHKFSIDKEKLREKSRCQYSKYIKHVYDEFSPNIVFSFNGSILLDEQLDYFRSKSKVVIWMYDSVQRKDREICQSHIDHIDAMFCFERTDLDFFSAIGKKAYYLPLSCDPFVYYPIECKEKDIDILFVGTIYTSKKRISLLEKVADRYHDKKILFYGEYKPYFKNPVKWLFRGRRDIFKNINIPPNRVNELYSRAKILLNVHNEQTIYGANQRVYEVCASGAYQICDYNPYIASLFPNNEVGLYKTDEECFSLIDDALVYDKTDLAIKARNIVISKHTFKNRIEEILEKLDYGITQR